MPEMTTTKSEAPKRRPGRPRIHETPATPVTIRFTPEIFRQMDRELKLERESNPKLTQRAFIERAIEREVKRKEKLRQDRNRRR